MDSLSIKGAILLPSFLFNNYTQFKKKLLMDNNETLDYCKNCGNCCTNYAGWYSPNQVLPQLIALAEGKLEGLGTKYQIDWYEDLEVVYVLRPVHTNSINRVYDGSWGGTCVNLKENGCSLSFDERPYQCQALVATDVGICSSKENKETIAELWKPFQHYFEAFQSIS